MGPWLDPFRIRLLDSTHPLATDLVASPNQYLSPAVSPLRFYSYRLGDRSVEGGYLYPPLPSPAAVR